jgi:hypothetical protein
MIVHILAVSLGLTAQTDDGEAAFFEAAQDFARCAALYDHLAEILDSEQMAANAEGLRGSGRGARLTSMFFAELASVDDQLIEDFVDDHYELELTRQAAFTERGEIDSDQMQKCVDLEPIQVEVVQTLRQQRYTNPNE